MPYYNKVGKIFNVNGGNSRARRCLTLLFPPFGKAGLRCPHRAARQVWRLRSATAAPAPPRCFRRRRRLASQPSTKFTPKSRTRRGLLAHNFGVNFPGCVTAVGTCPPAATDFKFFSVPLERHKIWGIKSKKTQLYAAAKKRTQKMRADP